MNEHLEALYAFLTTQLAAFGMNLLGAIVTLIVGFVVAGWLARLTTRAMRRLDGIDAVFIPLPGKIVRVAVIIVTLIAVLQRFGVQTASLIAMLGAAGLAIGLALQGTLSNVASGVMILLFRPFKIGDAVQIDGQVYVIDSIDFFLCNAHLPDGPSAVLPNSAIWGKTLVNYSVMDRGMRRIDEVYRIAYEDNIDTAIGILQRIVAEESRVLKDPAPLVAVQQLSDSSVDILFRVWIASADWWDTKLHLLKRCKEELARGGCRAPYPQRNVHMLEAPAATVQ